MSIDGRDVDPHGSLTGVLRAATAPAHPAELAGEQEALAAFRVAQSAPRRSLLARILTVKAVIIAAAAVSTGVVVAATGLPWPHTESRPPADSPVTVDPASVPAVTHPAGPSSSSSKQKPPGPETPPSTIVPGNTGGAQKPPHDRENDKPRPGEDEKDKDKNKDDEDNDRAGSSARDVQPTEQASPQQTPDSSARGAVTAAPPSGGEPPSQGG